MYELNFIWVGSQKMPDEQLFNLDLIRDLSLKKHSDTEVRIWVTDDLNVGMKAYLLSRKYILEDISQLLDPEKYPTTAEITELLRGATLPSGLGDILKFLILTRKRNPGMPAKRFYLEADNKYRADLDDLVNNRPFMYEPIENPYTKEIMAKPDGFFIDVTEEVCKPIMACGPEYVEILLSDATINHCIKQIININKEQGFTIESAVLNSFGLFPSTLCKSLLLRANMWGNSELGNKGFSVRVAKPGRSWVNSAAEAYRNDKSTPENIIRSELIAVTIRLSGDSCERCIHIMNDPDYWEERSKDLNKTAKSQRRLSAS